MPTVFQSEATQKIYNLILEEYHYQNSFHNYVMDGWFSMPVKRISDDMGMFYFEMKPYIKHLEKHEYIETKTINKTTYIRLAEKR